MSVGGGESGASPNAVGNNNANQTVAGSSADSARSELRRSANALRPNGRMLRVRTKFLLALGIGLAWATLSIVIAQRWIADLSALTDTPVAYLVIFSIAIIPGFMNAFIVAGLIFDNRPRRVAPASILPGISILVAAYNEEDSILTTLESIDRQDYRGPFEVIVIDDGSKDRTLEKLRSATYPWLKIIAMPKNGGKARALNAGLEKAHFALTITLDADSYLYRNALAHIVGRMLGDPPNTAAVAGSVLVRNSRINLITKMQEWDYFHGIAAIKRLQSLFQGTLVAQGAFSLYKTDIVRQLGGWPECVGEDIVLTWSMLEKGYRVGYCEDGFAFTNAPTTLKQFIRQRQRWSRGLIEAFRAHAGLLFRFRMSTVFIWWNLFFPLMDLTYTLVYIPGIIIAIFGFYWIVGPMTLLVLPLTFVVNFVMFLIQGADFVEQGLKVRRNWLGLIIYTLLYGIILQPACVWGYLSELTGLRKSWGTK
jgi:biofilm PGA synthesis N-glycosyltransferase PgaC